MCPCHFVKVLFFLILLSISGLGRAGNTLVIEDTFQQAALGDYITYMEFLDQPATLDELLKSPQPWQKPTKNPPNFGFSKAGYWFKVDIANTAERSQSLMLSIEYPLLDHLDIYLLTEGQISQHFTVGDELPFSARPIPSRHFVVPLQFVSAKNSQLFVYLKTSGSAQLPANLWSKDAYYQRDVKQSLGLGLYYGFLTIMVFYNLFLYFTVKDRTYLAYVVYVTTFCLTQASLSGHSYQYLWPEQPYWNDTSFSVLVCLANFGAALFCMQFLALKHNAPRLHRLVFFIASTSAALAFGCIFFLHQANIFRMLSAVMTAVNTLIMLFVGFYLWRNGLKHARFYIIGWTVFLAGAALISLAIIGILPMNFLTEHSAKIGSVLEVVFLSFALADRINMERQEKQEAQKRLHEMRFEMFTESFKQKEITVANEAAMRAKDEFLSTMSHEIRTPMNGVIGVLQLFEGTPLDTQQQELLRVMHGSAQTLLSIINDILDFSKIQAGKMQIEAVSFDLHLLLQDIAGLYNMTTKLNDELRFCLRIAPETPRYVEGDPMRVKQILTNYLNNAVKFTANGTIELRAEPIKSTEPNQSTMVRLSVKDTGIGIDAEAQQKLFQSYSQTSQDTARKYGGTGLGLAICKKLSELMGGTVGVDSEKGKGSTFWCTVSLPPSKEPLQSDVTPGKTHAITFSHVKVLVAEDNAVNQFVVKNMLRKLGITDVVLAENGEEALAFLAKGRFDLVLMDCNMPVMDGFEATRRIRQQEIENGAVRIPIAALTANAMAEEQEKSHAAGMDLHITKPLVLADLAASIERLLDRVDVQGESPG